MPMRQALQFLWEVIILRIDVDGLFEYAAVFLKYNIHWKKLDGDSHYALVWAPIEPGWVLSGFVSSKQLCMSCSKSFKIYLSKSLKLP